MNEELCRKHTPLPSGEGRGEGYNEHFMAHDENDAYTEERQSGDGIDGAPRPALNVCRNISAL
jgi:hypothetical protein